MKYLLDVNVLLAMYYDQHMHHARVERWLPAWVERSPQTTDGHLVELAAEHGLRLLTLDERIPGAELVPHLAGPPLMVREETFLDELMSEDAMPAAWRSTGSTGLWLE